MRPYSVIAVWLGVLTPAVAAAQGAEESLLHTCFEERTAGNHAASLAACERAVALAPSGRSLAQLGLTEMALQRWVASATHLEDALADREHPWVQRNRGPVEGALRTVREHVGAVEVSTDVPEATAALGADPPRPVARTLYGPAGAATLTVRAPDGRRSTREVRLTAGEVTRVRVELPAAATTNGSERPVPPPVVPPQRPAPVAHTGLSTRRVLAFTAGGLAVAGFGLALAAWRLREDAVVAYNGSTCPTGDTPDMALAARCGIERAAADSDRARWDAVAAVGLAAGGAFAVTSVILFVTEPSRRASATSWACAPSLLHAGGLCTVSF